MKATDMGRPNTMSNRLPRPRGHLSELVISALRAEHTATIGTARVDEVRDPLTDDDLHLALHCLYGLHYEGFRGVDEVLEWDPALLRLRRRLEAPFLLALRDEQPVPPSPSADEVPAVLRSVIAEGAGSPSPSSHLETDGSIDELRELLVHRSIYQRKEADAHTWGIPRLRGAAKSAMVLIQADEYGEGEDGRSHAELFGVTMDRLGLDPTPGAYIDVVPGVTLATDNLVSLLGLHRALRGALVGHLAVFEMTSVVPMSRYAAAIRRLTGDDGAAEFYDVHVVADAVHEVVAAERLAAGAIRSEPVLAADVVFGARAVMNVEARLASHLMSSWEAGRSSLRLVPSTSAGDQRVDLVRRHLGPQAVAG
jgi:hypothetical protein